MRYRVLASFQGAPYEAGIGPEESDVVLFAACPPPENLRFEPATGHWRKQVNRAHVQSLYESRPVGMFRGERCVVLDDLTDRLHIVYLGHDALRAAQLGYWEVDRGVFELITPRQEVTDIVEQRLPLKPAGDSGEYLRPVHTPPGGTPIRPFDDYLSQYSSSQSGSESQPGSPGFVPSGGSGPLGYSPELSLNSQVRSDQIRSDQGLPRPVEQSGVAVPVVAEPPLPLEAQALRAATTASRRSQKNGQGRSSQSRRSQSGSAAPPEAQPPAGPQPQAGAQPHAGMAGAGGQAQNLFPAPVQTLAPGPELGSTRLQMAPSAVALQAPERLPQPEQNLVAAPDQAQAGLIQVAGPFPAQAPVAVPIPTPAEAQIPPVAMPTQPVSAPQPTIPPQISPSQHGPYQTGPQQAFIEASTVMPAEAPVHPSAPTQSPAPTQPPQAAPAAQAQSATPAQAGTRVQPEVQPPNPVGQPIIHGQLPTAQTSTPGAPAHPQNQSVSAPVQLQPQPSFVPVIELAPSGIAPSSADARTALIDRAAGAVAPEPIVSQEPHAPASSPQTQPRQTPPVPADTAPAQSAQPQAAQPQPLQPQAVQAQAAEVSAAADPASAGQVQPVPMDPAQAQMSAPAPHLTAQHLTAQHPAAQHPTAPDLTAQHHAAPLVVPPAPAPAAPSAEPAQVSVPPMAHPAIVPLTHELAAAAGMTGVEPTVRAPEYSPVETSSQPAGDRPQDSVQPPATGAPIAIAAVADSTPAPAPNSTAEPQAPAQAAPEHQHPVTSGHAEQPVAPLMPTVPEFSAARLQSASAPQQAPTADAAPPVSQPTSVSQAAQSGDQAPAGHVGPPEHTAVPNPPSAPAGTIQADYPPLPDQGTGAVLTDPTPPITQMPTTAGPPAGISDASNIGQQAVSAPGAVPSWIPQNHVHAQVTAPAPADGRPANPMPAHPAQPDVDQQAGLAQHPAPRLEQHPQPELPTDQLDPVEQHGHATAPRRRRATKRRLPTQKIFSDLAAQAAIPAAAYAIGEDVDGAMCLVRTDEGFEVFNAAAGARHEVRLFSDEESAYFYLFGVLVADSVRTGALVPRD